MSRYRLISTPVPLSVNPIRRECQGSFLSRTYPPTFRSFGICSSCSGVNVSYLNLFSPEGDDAATLPESNRFLARSTGETLYTTAAARLQIHKSQLNALPAYAPSAATRFSKSLPIHTQHDATGHSRSFCAHLLVQPTFDARGDGIPNVAPSLLFHRQQLLMSIDQNRKQPPLRADSKTGPIDERQQWERIRPLLTPLLDRELRQRLAAVACFSSRSRGRVSRSRGDGG